jgi:hypothetical protein
VEVGGWDQFVYVLDNPNFQHHAYGDHFNRSSISPSLTVDVYDFPVAHPSPIEFHHQAFPGQIDPAVTGDYLVPTHPWSIHGFEQQDAIVANGTQIDTPSNSTSLNSAFQPPSQSSNLITADRVDITPIIFPLTFDEGVLYSNGVPNRQFDSTPQLPDFSRNNDFNGPDSIDNSMSTSTTASELNRSPSTETKPPIANLAKLALPASTIATAPTNIDVNASRLTCDHPGCPTTFARPGDLSRHKKKHSPPEYPCPVDNCGRKGDKAFYRPDKLHDHQRKKHKMAV